MILVISTGGTIGALAYPDPGHPPKYAPMPPTGQDYVRDALRTRRFRQFRLSYLALEQRDSKHITDAYRAQLLELLGSAPTDKILITHGTDSLLKTANYIFRRRLPKTILLTGAMTPLANGSQSDGCDNLFYALNFLQRPKPPGVFIVLHGGEPKGDWCPRLYRHHPGRYIKFYDADGRYHRLMPALS